MHEASVAAAQHAQHSTQHSRASVRCAAAAAKRTLCAPFPKQLHVRP